MYQPQTNRFRRLTSIFSLSLVLLTPSAFADDGDPRTTEVEPDNNLTVTASSDGDPRTTEVEPDNNLTATASSDGDPRTTEVEPDAVLGSFTVDGRVVLILRVQGELYFVAADAPQ